MIDNEIEITASPETVMGLLAPERWLDWLAADGPYLVPASLTIDPETGQWLATAADGQAAHWHIDQRADRITCYAPGPLVEFEHELSIAAPAEGQVVVTWATDYLIHDNWLGRWLAGKRIKEGVEDMQIFSLLNLKEWAERPADELDDE